MTYLFHPDVEFELNASIDYHKEYQTKLGLEFVYEIQNTIQRILKFPTAEKMF